MTEPATLPGDKPDTIRSGGHSGKVYVHNPLNGEVAEIDPADAADRVYAGGWQPVSKDDATRIDAHQLLKDSITPGQAVGLGLKRGLTAGLSDLVPQDDNERRLDAATGEAFPWLTPIAEGAGMLAPFGLTAGLGAAGEAVTGALRGGEELGFLGKAATRAAGMGAEGAAYGGIGAARESQIDDTPLTAQKLLSGAFGGALVGGAMGGGIGALEGSGSLLRKMFKDTSAAREELNAPGLRDADVSPALERAGLGPLEPGALDKLQAGLFNQPNITPEFLAAAKASPGIMRDLMEQAGPARAESEANFAKALNELHDGNQDALAGWQGNLKQDKVRNWIGPESEHVSDAGNLVERMKALPLPERFKLSNEIAEAVERAGKENPQAFGELMNSVSASSEGEALINVQRALLHGDQHVLDNLFNSRLLNDENIAALKIESKLEVNVGAFDQSSMRPESYDYVRANAKDLGPPRIEITPQDGEEVMHVGDGRHRLAVAYENGEREITANVVRYDEEGNVVSQGEQKVKLSNKQSKNPRKAVAYDADIPTNPGIREPLAQQELQRLLPRGARESIEPTWKTASLDFVDRNIEHLNELAAQNAQFPGYAGKPGQVKKLSGIMAGARQSIQEGDRANAFIELDSLKKRLAIVRADAGPRIPADQAIAGHAGRMHEEARQLLERPEIWGTKAASAQREMNAILHERFTRDNDFYNAFYRGAGHADPKNEWAEAKVADPAKIRGVMDRLVNPEHSLELQQFKTHISESNKLADIMEKYYAPDEAQKAVIQRMRDGTETANKSMDDALHFALRENQGKILLGAAHGGVRGAAGSVAAYALGGPLGLAGVVAAKALINPGRVWRMRAIVERMFGSHNGRIADGLAGLVDKATRVAGSAAAKSTRVLGSAALLTQDVAKRQKAYGDTLHDLAAMASNQDMVLKAITSWHGPDLRHMPNTIPEMAAALQRGAQFCLKVAPARPIPGLFSDDELGLIGDGEAEEFSHTVHAAMDPATIFERIAKGQLSQQVLSAAQATAPDLVEDMRQTAVQMFTHLDRGVKISPVKQQGLALLLGMQPHLAYLLSVQSGWDDSASAPTQRVSPGNMGDTGVNERYSKSTYSAADRIESGEHQL